MWIIQPLEIKILGAHTGKFRLTATSDEDGGGPFGLCNHEHDSPQEAAECPEARERSYVYGGIRPETIEAAERAELARLIAKYGGGVSSASSVSSPGMDCSAISILQGCGLHGGYYDTIEKAAEGVRDIIQALRADLHDPPHDIQCAVLRKLGVEGFTKEGVAPTHKLIPLPTSSHGSDCLLCGHGKPHEGDPERPCSACGEIIGHGAHQHRCDGCGAKCCTACSVDGPNNTVLCDECDPASARHQAQGAPEMPSNETGKL